jgi:hypothetical protein
MIFSPLYLSQAGEIPPGRGPFSDPAHPLYAAGQKLALTRSDSFPGGHSAAVAGYPGKISPAPRRNPSRPPSPAAFKKQETVQPHQCISGSGRRLRKNRIGYFPLRKISSGPAKAPHTNRIIRLQSFPSSPGWKQFRPHSRSRVPLPTPCVFESTARRFGKGASQEPHWIFSASENIQRAGEGPAYEPPAKSTLKS